MFGLGTLTWLLVIVLMFAALLRRRRQKRATPDSSGGDTGRNWPILGGIVLLFVVIGVVFGYSIYTLAAVDNPTDKPAVHIQIAGRRWWWEVKYPNQGVTTTNELHNGSSRPGPNLYTNSLIALDHKTSKLLWYNQVKPHDLFNLDFQISPMLATIKVNGQDKAIVIGSGKLGVVYAFDQETGKTLWSTPIGLHQNDDLQELPLDKDATTWVAPGAWGGVEAPMAHADGVITPKRPTCPLLITPRRTTL